MDSMMELLGGSNVIGDLDTNFGADLIGCDFIGTKVLITESE